ncbi:MAG TPA: hypothetical protein VN578_17355 [Candidatus Binatia bacterium]|jgi:hypothetical protein|nr:hypothetical protein [Candidatus Binatia bacterium]
MNLTRLDSGLGERAPIDDSIPQAGERGRGFSIPVPAVTCCVRPLNISNDAAEKEQRQQPPVGLSPGALQGAVVW